MTKEQIEAIIAADPVRQKLIEKKKERAAQLQDAIVLLNRYCDSKASGILVIASDRRSGSGNYVLRTDGDNADLLLMLGLIKTVEKQLLDRIQVR